MAGVKVVKATAVGTANHGRPYPVLPEISIHVVLRGGMVESNATQVCDGSGVRGFGGSNPEPHPEGIIGPKGLGGEQALATQQSLRNDS